MSDFIETMAYNKVETPWHGLGNPVDDTLTVPEMLVSATLNWTVSKRTVWYQGTDGSMIQAKDEYVLVRDSDSAKLSMVGATYKPVQNEVAMEFFAKFVHAGSMKMETAGSLAGGKYIWCLARIGQDFTLGKGKSTDAVNNYLLLMSPHVFGKSLIIQFTPIRVVCWNTLSFALGANLKGKGDKVFRLPHHTHFNDEAKAKAEVALGLATAEATEFQAAATKLSNTKAKPAEVTEYFCEVLEWTPRDEDGKIRQEPRVLTKFKNALTFSPGADLTTAEGTWWGALNAVSHVVDHELGRERDTALEAAWVGRHVELKRRAFDLAVKKAA